MLISPKSLTVGARALFMGEAARFEPDLVGTLARYEQSDKPLENYVWLAQAPVMRALRDTVEFPGVTDALYSIENQTYAVGLEIPREHVEDDQVGLIRQRIQGLAPRAALFPNKLIIEGLIAGTSTTTYDGVAFFSASHPARGSEGGNQSNLLTGTGTTDAAIELDLRTAMAAMQSLKDEAGEPFHDYSMSSFMITCPPSMVVPFLRITSGQLIIAGNTNVYPRVGDFVVRGEPRLSDVNDWYLSNRTPGMQPMIFQDRRPLEFASQEQPDSDTVFLKELYRFKVSRRCAVGFGNWQNAVKVTNS